MPQALYEHYDQLLGANFVRSRRFDLEQIGVPSMDLAGLVMLFTEEEVLSVIREIPNDKTPGPDGFTGHFYKTAWTIIKGDIMNAFNAFWSQEARSFNLLNDAYMVLLKKKEQPQEIRDYQPISLMHSFRILITKCLASRLGATIDSLVHVAIRAPSLRDGAYMITSTRFVCPAR